LYFFAWILGIDSRAPLSLFGHERTESRDGYFSALLERFGNDFYVRFNHVFGLLFCDADFVGNMRYELGFIHRNDVDQSGQMIKWRIQVENTPFLAKPQQIHERGQPSPPYRYPDSFE